MPEPVLRIRWQLTHADFGVYVANCEDDVRVLQAPVYEELIPLIDGTRTLSEITAQLRTTRDEGSVRRALRDLEQQGLLAEEDPDQTPIDATAEVVSVGPNHGSQVAATLVALGVKVQAGGRLRIVITHDYLDPALDDLNRDALQRGLAWALARPAGRRHWIGPLFLPQQTACWRCLAVRLSSNLFGAKGMQTSPAASAATETLIAMEGAKWLRTGLNPAIEGRMQALDPASLRGRAHLVVRFPQCPACGSVWSAGKKWNGDRTRKRSAVAVLRRHESELTGVFSHLESVRSGPGVYIYQALINRILRSDCSGATTIVRREGVCGKGLDRRRSRAACMAEAIERYSLQFHADEPRVRARRQDLGPLAVVPIGAGPEAGREKRDQEIEWVMAKSLTDGTERFVPARCCYLGYSTGGRLSNSNGCAAGNTFQEAALRGFLELVERDAVALWWYNRARRPPVEPDAGALTDYLRAQGRRLHVLEVTTDFGIPAMVAVTARQDGTDVTIGSAASMGAEEAVERALLEATTLLDNPRRDVRLDRSPYLMPAPGMPPPVRARIRQGTAAQHLAWCVAKAKQLGLDVIAVDMTRPEVGFPVARIIVPGMCHWRPHFVPGRLFDVPVTLGWRKTRVKERDINPLPFAS